MLKIILDNRNNPWFAVALIFVAVCFVMMHLPLMGIPLGTDLPQHLQFASTYQQAILSGDFFPGWAPTDNYGFGSVGIRFYPPVAYYLMALTQMLTGNWYDTFWTNAFFWMFVGAIGMYLWSRCWLSPIESAAVAIFYSFAPYHRFQIYHFILFAEFAAAGILPFCFLTLTNIIRRGRPLDIVLFGISFALLILTHIPTTILGAIGLAIYGIIITGRRDFVKTMTRIAVGGLLGLAASAYHWLRLVREMDWVRHTAENFAVDFYDFRQHLFPLKQHVDLFTPPLNNAIVFLFLTLLPIFVYMLMRRKTKTGEPDESRIALAVTVTGTVALLMTTSLTLVIWNNVGIMQKVQFPWRWLAIGYMFGSFAFVFALTGIYRICRTWNRAAVLIPAVVYSLTFIFFVVATTHDMIPLNREDFATETKGLAEKRGCSCWWPTWGNPAAFKKKEKISAESRNFSVSRWESERREFTIDAGPEQQIRIGTFYYPHWQATVNDRPVEVGKDADGVMMIPVGAEKSEVVLSFHEPQMLQFALAGSIAAWLLLLFFLVYFYRKNQNPNKIQ